MKLTKPTELPNLVTLESVDPGSVVTCAQHKGEMLFVPSREEGMDAIDNENAVAVLFNLENGQPRELSLDTTVVCYEANTSFKHNPPNTKQYKKNDDKLTRPKGYLYGLNSKKDVVRLYDTYADHGHDQAVNYIQNRMGYSKIQSEGYLHQLVEDMNNSRFTIHDYDDIPF